MNAEVFVDTNVFLYAISDQAEEQAKTDRARALLLTEKWGWSVQVAGEFFVTVTSPKRQFQHTSSGVREKLAQLSNVFTGAGNSTSSAGNSRAVSGELLGCGNHCCCR